MSYHAKWLSVFQTPLPAKGSHVYRCIENSICPKSKTHYPGWLDIETNVKYFLQEARRAKLYHCSSSPFSCFLFSLLSFSLSILKTVQDPLPKVTNPLPHPTPPPSSQFGEGQTQKACMGLSELQYGAGDLQQIPQPCFSLCRLARGVSSATQNIASASGGRESLVSINCHHSRWWGSPPRQKESKNCETNMFNTVTAHDAAAHRCQAMWEPMTSSFLVLCLKAAYWKSF